jgi:hypothetical protein
MWPTALNHTWQTTDTLTFSPDGEINGMKAEQMGFWHSTSQQLQVLNG